MKSLLSCFTLVIIASVLFSLYSCAGQLYVVTKDEKCLKAKGGGKFNGIYITAMDSMGRIQYGLLLEKPSEKFCPDTSISLQDYHLGYLYGDTAKARLLFRNPNQKFKITLSPSYDRAARHFIFKTDENGLLKYINANGFE